MHSALKRQIPGALMNAITDAEADGAPDPGSRAHDRRLPDRGAALFALLWLSQFAEANALAGGAGSR
jgi:hypothetical protein